jgi:hypothetical protein
MNTTNTTRFPIIEAGKGYCIMDRRHNRILRKYRSFEAAQKAWPKEINQVQDKEKDAAPVKPSEHDFSGSLEDWEDRVFINAEHFTVCRKVEGKGGVETKRFARFEQAQGEAGDDPRALVYVVTASGRSVCLIRARWDHYRKLWSQYNA